MLTFDLEPERYVHFSAFSVHFCVFCGTERKPKIRNQNVRAHRNVNTRDSLVSLAAPQALMFVAVGEEKKELFSVLKKSKRKSTQFFNRVLFN